MVVVMVVVVVEHRGPRPPARLLRSGSNGRTPHARAVLLSRRMEALVLRRSAALMGSHRLLLVPAGVRAVRTRWPLGGGSRLSKGAFTTSSKP